MSWGFVHIFQPFLIDELDPDRPACVLGIDTGHKAVYIAVRICECSNRIAVCLIVGFHDMRRIGLHQAVEGHKRFVIPHNIRSANPAHKSIRHVSSKENAHLLAKTIP